MKKVVLDGRKEADRMLRRVRRSVQRLRVRPTLATVIVGRRPDSLLYIRMKQQAAAQVGLRTKAIQLPSSISQTALTRRLALLGRDLSVTGVLLQLPLPSHLESKAVIRAINPHQDVDGLGEQLVYRSPFLQSLLHLARLGRPRSGQALVLAQNSPLRRRLVTALRAQKFRVTVETARRRLPSGSKQADLIISFRGYGPRIKKNNVSARTVIIDGGIRQREGRVVGDVDESVRGFVRAVSPVPGGVGPLTVAYLIQNTVQAAQKKTARP